MSRYGFFLVMVLIIAIALCGCTSSSGTEKKEIAGEKTTVTPMATTGSPEVKDSGNLSFAEEIKIIQDRLDKQPPIVMPIGSTTDIYLKENPTTGYSWNVSVTSGLEIVNDTFIGPDSRLMGAGGDHHWTIKGTTVGNQTFSAVYRRPWEAPSPNDITYVQHFIVTA